MTTLPSSQVALCFAAAQWTRSKYYVCYMYGTSSWLHFKVNRKLSSRRGTECRVEETLGRQHKCLLDCGQASLGNTTREIKTTPAEIWPHGYKVAQLAGGNKSDFDISRDCGRFVFDMEGSDDK